MVVAAKIKGVKEGTSKCPSRPFQEVLSGSITCQEQDGPEPVGQRGTPLPQGMAMEAEPTPAAPRGKKAPRNAAVSLFQG